jgi:hypothetical protein
MLTTPVGRHLTSDDPALILKVAVDIATVVATMADKGYVHRSVLIVMMRISARVVSAVFQCPDISLRLFSSVSLLAIGSLTTRY